MTKLKAGKPRKVTHDITLRTSYSIGTLKAGREFTIQQVDKENRKVLVHNVWLTESTVESKTEAIAND